MTSKRTKVLAGAMAVAAVAAGMAVLHTSRGDADQTPRKPAAEARFDLAVVVEPASIGSVSMKVKASGRVRPAETVSVMPGVTGKVLLSVRVRQGDSVKAGELIASVDSRALDAAVVKAEAALESARAGQAAAGATLERTAKLASAGTATRQAWDEAAAAASSARSAFRTGTESPSRSWSGTGRLS